TLEEVEADLVTLWLQDPRTGQFEERVRKASPRSEDPPALGAPNLEEILTHYRLDRPLLMHGIKAHRFLTDPPLDKRIVSFCSIPLKVRQSVIGMLNAYSFTKGNKFNEGQRKLLAVLGSRAAVSIENARLYENLVDANRELTGANHSLEEN